MTLKKETSTDEPMKQLADSKCYSFTLSDNRYCATVARKENKYTKKGGMVSYANVIGEGNAQSTWKAG